MKKIFQKAGVIVTSALLAPLASFAQTAIPVGGGPAPLPADPVADVGHVTGLFCVIIRWMFYGLMLLTVMYILIAAFNYLTSGGDPEKTEKARNSIIYAAVAVAVALLARGLPSIISSFFGTGSIATC